MAIAQRMTRNKSVYRAACCEKDRSEFSLVHVLVTGANYEQKILPNSAYQKMAFVRKQSVQQRS